MTANGKIRSDSTPWKKVSTWRPRAPTDNWNLWHEGHIDPLFDRLIEDMIVFEEVNPNRVYITGYSAGGDGVYQLAPRMADRFAAAAMMAGHPNETSPLGLRNWPFAIHMGDKDAAYKRNEVAAEWRDKLKALREADPQGYEHLVKLHAGRGHWMNGEDAEHCLGWPSSRAIRIRRRSFGSKMTSSVRDSIGWLVMRPKPKPVRRSSLRSMASDTGYCAR